MNRYAGLFKLDDVVAVDVRRRFVLSPSNREEDLRSLWDRPNRDVSLVRNSYRMDSVSWNTAAWEHRWRDFAYMDPETQILNFDLRQG